MPRTTPLITFDMDCQPAIARLRAMAAAQGLRVVRSFDLRSACATPPDLTCSHHGDVPCDCQVVVLLVYGEQSLFPASLLLHAHRGQTQIEMAASSAQSPQHDLETAVRAAILEPAFDLP